MSRFSVPASLRCGHRDPPGVHSSDAGKHRIESGYTVLTGVHREVVLVVSNLFKTTGAHRDASGAKQRRLIPGHHRSFSGMKRISTVRLPGHTIANRHKLCPRWRYGDPPVRPRSVTEESRPSPCRTTVYHGGSR